jgi:hypothetical protein
VKKGLSPSLKMDMPSIGKRRPQFLEHFQGEMPIFPSVSVDCAWAIDAGSITGRSDFHLDPVKGWSKKGNKFFDNHRSQPLVFWQENSVPPHESHRIFSK